LLPRVFAAPILHRVEQPDKGGQTGQHEEPAAGNPPAKQPSEETSKYSPCRGLNWVRILFDVHMDSFQISAFRFAFGLRVSGFGFAAHHRQALHRRDCSRAAMVSVAELLREAFGVRPACWRCRWAEAGRRREQAPRTPNASRNSIAAWPLCAISISLPLSLLGSGRRGFGRSATGVSRA